MIPVVILFVLVCVLFYDQSISFKAQLIRKNGGVRIENSDEFIIDLICENSDCVIASVYMFVILLIVFIHINSRGVKLIDMVRITNKNFTTLLIIIGT